MKRILTLSFLLSTSLYMVAQTPKWYKKARKAQVAVIAYDAKGEIHQGQGFYTNADGLFVSSYDLVKGANKVTLITTDNKTATAQRLAGANCLYNVAKLQSDATKTPYNPSATAPVMKGDVLYVMPLSTQKDATPKRDTVVGVEQFEGTYAYYRLTDTTDERLEGCPVMNEEGQTVGILQISGQGDKRAAYVLSLNYAEALAVRALDYNNADLRAIHLPMALPADESQASSFLYLVSTQHPDYLTHAADFINRFPQSPIGYIQQAEAQIARCDYEAATQTYSQALKAKTGKDDELHYALSKAIYGACINKVDARPESWTLDKALEEARAANSANPSPIYTSMEGFCHYAMEHYAEALTAFSSLSTTNLRSAEYFNYCAECKKKLDAPREEILALQDSAIATFTRPYTQEAAPYFILRAQTLIAMDRHRDAVKDYNEYGHIMSRSLTDHFYYQRYQLQLKCRYYEAALSDIRQARLLKADNPLYHAEEAAVCYRCGLFDEAIIACREAIRLDPEFADPYRLYGMSLKQQGKNKEAKTQLQKAADLGDEVAKKLLSE